MNLDYDYDRFSDVSGWVKQSQVEKDVKKSHVISANISRTENGKQHKIPKGSQRSEPISKLKRLTFKKKKKRDTTPAAKISEVEETYFSVERLPEKACFRPSKIIEFKKGEDGYGLIAFDESEIPDIIPDSEFQSDCWTDSISDESSQTEGIEEPKENLHYSYKKYLLLWKDIKAGVKNEFLPLPVYQANELNVRAVTDFVIDLNNLKHERIRWHPDKMKNILKKSGMLNNENEHKVTQVFQVVNEAFENFIAETL
ncbi:hypothetical protein CANINC_002940 [Pichia inconspicua]|uniref:Uncharacterized protein n=1 Tax=Pichia inconspicua TaxID=52247 RepID=A0A4T0X1I2_9ASCO|nr:hypothetical protein CANINC_002940 [[Candida] inconspicua]